MKILDGRVLARKKLELLKQDIATLPFVPGLAVILVGKDPASHLYVSLKERESKKLGIYFRKIILAQTIAQKEIISLIHTLNNDENIHGILVQLPLPERFNTSKIIRTIVPEKDVDGFGSHPLVLSPTIQAIIDLLRKTGLSLVAKKATLFVNSEVFYHDLAKAFKRKGIIIIKDSKSADIIVVAKGKPGFLSPEGIREGAVVIDVGITKVNGKLRGDVMPAVAKKAGFLSPVPGGVGPLTVANLLTNLVFLARHSLTC